MGMRISLVFSRCSLLVHKLDFRRMNSWRSERLRGAIRKQFRYLLLASIALGNVNVGTSGELVLVSVQPLAQLVEFPETTAPAEVITANDSRLSAEITSVIKSIPVEVGQVVEPGTLLVELEKTDIEIALKQAQYSLTSVRASYRLAKSRLESVKALANQKLISEKELSQRQSEMVASRAKLMVQKVAIEQLQSDLEKTLIRAPFKAIVTEHLGHVGELAMPGTRLIHVLDADQVLVSSKLQPMDVAFLKSAAEINFVSRNAQYPVEFHRVTPALDAREHSQNVRLKFKTDAALIGTTGRLVWRGGNPYLPANVVVRREDALGVFVLRNGKVSFVPLPDAEEGRPARINLASETKVIIDGRYVVKDGDSVRIASDDNRLD